MEGQGSQSQGPGGEQDLPQLLLTSPSFGPKKSRLSIRHRPTHRGDGGLSGQSLHRRVLGSKKEKHIRIEEPVRSEEPARSRPPSISTPSSVYLGSYIRSPGHSQPHSRANSIKSGRTSPRPSTSQIHLNEVRNLLRDLELDLETYGITETRDGFFDSVFLSSLREDKEDLLEVAKYTLPAAFKKSSPLSSTEFIPKQWHGLKKAAHRVFRTRAGIQVAKSFLGFFIAYILCLWPVTGQWLGRYNYVMALSAIVNHPGRPIGSQIDGLFQTILGTIAGLGGGALALYVSDSTSVAAQGYGGVLEVFLIVIMGSLAVIRSYFIRLYQFVLCAGLAVLFTCLTETGRSVIWSKLLAYGIPWVLGQAICLIVCCAIFPDGGARHLAAALHDAFGLMHKGLEIPRPDRIKTHRELASTFVNLSQVYRDLTLELSVTRFNPRDVEALRNSMQAVIRSLLALKSETELFDDFQELELVENYGSDNDSIINIDEVLGDPPVGQTNRERKAIQLVVGTLAQPTQALLSYMRQGLACCDAVLLDMSGYRRYLGPPPDISSDMVKALTKLRKAIIKFDVADEELVHNPGMPSTFSDHPEVVQLFLFVNPVRQAAQTIESLLVKVMQMQQKDRSWRLYLPSYPFLKGLQRTNATVRHDRGGLSTGLFFRSQKELNKLMYQSRKGTFKPIARHKGAEHEVATNQFPDPDLNDGEDVIMDSKNKDKKNLGYKLWTLMHRLQGFETRFAFKTAIVISLLSVPAFVDQSKWWYNEYQCWWGVIIAWTMMHPRRGGNFTDLVSRVTCAILGALWGGLAYAARDGNRVVIGAFAAIFMIPMLYRFTESNHSRSGLVGCITFTVVSLAAVLREGTTPTATIAWTLGASMAAGVLAAILVSWLLWPFIARHELRKSLSLMVYYLALIYRGVVAQYIYYEDGHEPNYENIQRSELLEGRLREGFVRLSDLLELTRHEPRLRAPFSPLPYSALMTNCEAFFEHLVLVRQSSLFFHPNNLYDSPEASSELLPYRRDAVAAILMNLYVLAGALRGNRKVPRYLPSAAAARKKLLDRMAEIELEQAEEKEGAREGKGDLDAENRDMEKGKARGRNFAEVYQFAYSRGLTQCVEQLEQLQKYTRAICGEVGFEMEDESESSEEETEI